MTPKEWWKLVLGVLMVATMYFVADLRLDIFFLAIIGRELVSQYSQQ